jgi:hypothetical protein
MKDLTVISRQSAPQRALCQAMELLGVKTKVIEPPNSIIELTNPSYAERLIEQLKGSARVAIFFPSSDSKTIPVLALAIRLRCLPYSYSKPIAVVRHDNRNNPQYLEDRLNSLGIHCSTVYNCIFNVCKLFKSLRSKTLGSLDCRPLWAVKAELEMHEIGNILNNFGGLTAGHPELEAVYSDVRQLAKKLENILQSQLETIR